MFRTVLLVASAFLAALAGNEPVAKKASDIRELKLRDWEPRSMMVTKATAVEKPRFPVVDAHNHLGGGKDHLTPAVVKRYLTEMNEAGVQTVVNLDGGWGKRLEETLEALDKAHPGRFLTYALVDFTDIDDKDWGEGLEGGGLHPLRAARTVSKRPAQGGHAMAGELLPHGLRRRPDDELGLGARRAELPRVPEVRDAGVRVKAIEPRI